MTAEQILKDLEEIFRDNFDDDELELTRETTADDIEDWDSLEQINLLTAMEKQFGVKFKLDDVRGLANVGDMVLIPAGSSIVFSALDHARFVYVTYPANWSEQAEG